ncbi:Thiol-disulfide isomerase-like protein [Ignavibacterium album JCM 16511]|uniref:Thiol-disulfide isomerase-like protein n=1 Tax=Ignavibacterium album (strain DSM 19864 / JCM 16511 / NBRC 101810 / Mat9-16) TaxID=945713 RepID=I0AN04_IGNAJ|nr:TlpA disulfide reductase family protein [Ignavibacterium album]AFH50361.1 Thiol-disulfide isomerase-like protein [Ignavibacterium album JCM 16511]
MKKIILILFISLSFFSFAQDELSQGKTAPNFKLESLDGNNFELTQALGKGPVLLSFWATWCKPCMEEMNELNKIYEELKEKGFTLLAISTDNEKTIAKVKPLVKSKGYNFTVLLDKNSDVARKYYAQQIPYSVLIDKDGKIISSHMGYMKGDEKKLREKILSLLK